MPFPALEAALEATNNIFNVIVDLDYVSNNTKGDTVFTVTFLDPVGDIPDLTANTTQGGVSVSVNEAVKGVSPLGGTFVVSYEGQYTGDIDFDASASEMKSALEAVATIDEVDVIKENLGSGRRRLLRLRLRAAFGCDSYKHLGG